MKCSNSRQAHGGGSPFTLVELLIVIAIVSILSSILFPALSKVKAKAQSILCMGNQRQIGMAMTQYSCDGGDYYPAATIVADAANGLQIYWYALIGPYINGQYNPQYTQYGTMPRQQWMSVYTCQPVDVKSSGNTYWPYNCQFSYGYVYCQNSAANGWKYPGNGSLKTGHVKQPSQKLLVSESPSSPEDGACGAFICANQGGSARIYLKHGSAMSRYQQSAFFNIWSSTPFTGTLPGTGNILHADLHVASYNAGSYNAEASALTGYYLD